MPEPKNWEDVGGPRSEGWEEVPRDHDTEEQISYEEELDAHLDMAQYALDKGYVEGTPYPPPQLDEDGVEIGEESEGWKEVTNAQKRDAKGRFAGVVGYDLAPQGASISPTEVGVKLADQHGHRKARAEGNYVEHDRKSLQEKFVTSKSFKLMEIPVGSVRRIGPISGASQSTGPIVVDVDKGNFQHWSDAGTSEVVILDGGHRHNEAVERGENTILAYVGKEAATYIAEAIPVKVK